ncbi:MAG UNVERIFIED_CONTAM: hypothetical protein LOD86_07265, partial [Thermobifida fusca]
GARLVQLSALNEISRALTQIISIDDLYHLLPPQLDRVLGIRSLTIALRDPATGQIAFPLDVVDGEPRTGASAGYSRDLYNHVIDSGQPLLTRRSAAVEIAELGFEHNEPGLKSLLAVPSLAPVTDNPATPRKYRDSGTAGSHQGASSAAGLVYGSSPSEAGSHGPPLQWMFTRPWLYAAARALLITSVPA